MSKQKKKISSRQLRSNISGNALVFALLIVAVTAIIAYALIETSSFAVRRTQQLSNNDACIEAVHAAESYAMRLLDQQEQTAKPGTMKTGAITSLDQDWIHPFEMKLGTDMTLSAKISDLQEKFNVNLLKQEVKPGVHSPELIYTRLLGLLGIADAHTLGESLSHWVKSETSATDGVYLERTPAYRAAHIPLASISELKLIQGYSAPLVERLLPYLSALPEADEVNVNTAPAIILAAILDTQEDLVHTLINERENYPYTNVEEFADRARTRGINIKDQASLQQVIVTNSTYFLLETELVCKKTTMVRYSVLERLNSGKVQLYRRTANL